MPYLALSATSTTGLFTLLGTIFGAIIAGTLAILIEVLRRRWQRQDAHEQSEREQRTTQIQEKKILYPQLLAKGVEAETLVVNMLFAKNPRYLEPGDTPQIQMSIGEAAEVFAKDVWPAAFPIMQEFLSIKSEVDMIAGEAVRRRAREYQRVIVQDMFYAGCGMRKKREGEDAGDLLLEAMRTELGDSALGSGNENNLKVATASD